MGIFRNIAIKTAIKKALLDMTEQIEMFARQMHHGSSFGKSVLIYATYNQFPDDLKDETWEVTFAVMVLWRAQSEMPSSSLIENQNEMVIFISLVTEWVASKGGNAANIYRKFSQP